MKILAKGDEVIILNNSTDPFVLKHLRWMQGQGYTLIENWEPPSADGKAAETVTEAVTETAEETVSPSSGDSVIVIDGKTYTKAELKKLLE